MRKSRNDCQAAEEFIGNLAWEKKQNRHLSVLFFVRLDKVHGRIE